MVTHAEKQKLMEQYRREPAVAHAVVLRCAAGLLIVALIAAIGTSPEIVGRADADMAQGEGSATAPRVSAAVSDAQKVTAQRRERHAQRPGYGGLQAASYAEKTKAAVAPEPGADEIALLLRERD
jgi:hypothetical protein